MFKILVLFSLVLVGCSQDDKGTKGGNPQATVTQTVHEHQANFPAKTGTIYGGWVVPDRAGQNGTSFRLDFLIGENTLGLLVTCVAKDNTTTTAYVEAKAVISSTSLTVDREYDSPAGNPCQATLNAGVISYSMVGDALILNGESLQRAY